MTIQLRKFQPDDLPALADLINRAVAFDQTDGSITLENLRARFELPYFDPQDNCLIAVTTDQQIVGYCIADLDPRVGQGWGDGHVDPDYRRQGIGRLLLRAADDRHRERAETQLRPDLPMIVTRVCQDTHAAGIALLESEGYQVVRVNWSMAIDLTDPIDVPPLPAGVTLRPFDRERDAYKVYESIQTTFRGHWGFFSIPYEVWQGFMFPSGHQDALWLVAVEGEGAPDDPIIGQCLCMPHRDPTMDMGWVEALGVRADWRKRGLASALLRQGYQTLRAHGFTRGGLSVDSENTTNAVALYERVGLRVYQRHLFYRKALRGDSALIWQ